MRFLRLVGWVIILLSGVGGHRLSLADPASVELGAVAWLRDYDAAVARSRETGKPLAVLFQEIPG